MPKNAKRVGNKNLIGGRKGGIPSAQMTISNLESKLEGGLGRDKPKVKRQLALHGWTPTVEDAPLPSETE